MQVSRAICLEDLRVEESAEGLEVSCACISDVGDFPGRLRAGIAGLEAGRAPDSLDWAAVALLLPAMAEGRDIVVRGALSRRLLHALNHDIQGVLTVLAPELRRIRIEAEAAAPDHRAPTGRIGTGFSAGIDSFATLSLYDPRSAEDTPKITDLAVFDVGAFGPPGSAQAGALFDRSARRCREVAARLGLGAVTVGSNLGALYAGRFPFQRSHTLRNVAAALLLGRHLDLHLYSSSYGPHHVAVQETHDIAFLDPVLLPMLSTGRMELYSAGAGLTRAEKTVRVARDPDAGTLLDVCITPADRRPADRPNCSRCWKCRRAMVTFDLLGRPGEP